MGHPRRYYSANSTYFITNRLAEGLPFVPNIYTRTLLFGVLTRAKKKHPGVALCAFLFMSNHYHLVLVLKDSPETLRRFMNYLNGEIAKLVTRWLGKRNVKVWAQRYHAAKLLTWDAALERMVYTLANPVNAQLCPKAEDWQGCSSWYALNDKQHRHYSWYRPGMAVALPNKAFNKGLQKALMADLQSKSVPNYELVIEPFAWMQCFAETRDMSEDAMREKFFSRLAEVEHQALQERRKKKIPCADQEKLATQNPHKPFRPKKYGRRVYCISTCEELRKQFIILYRSLCEQAAKAWSEAKAHYTQAIMPPGMFPPATLPNSSALPVFGYL